MKRIFLTIIFLIFLLLPINISAFEAIGWDGKDYYTHYGTTADDITFQWTWDTFNADTDDFEVILYNPERDISTNMGFTKNFEITFKVPKTGHWIGKVRVRRLIDAETEEYEYTEWAESTDSTLSIVDGENRSWWVFAWIEKSGPIIFDLNNNR